MQLLQEENLVKYISKFSLPKVEVDQKLYITMPKNDELTEFGNLDSNDIPEMVLNDIDIPFELNLKRYDQTEMIKFRIIAENDWGQIDWK